MLYFYKAVYREVVEALPINGGAYNGLLNGTTKILAATAGIMTITSYIATAVISAKTAVEYLFKFVSQTIGHETLFQQLVLPTVVLILFFFALLVINGVSDSAKVAAGIFSFHLFTLTVFIALGAHLFIAQGGHFYENALTTDMLVNKHGGLATTLFLAFSVSLLGVSGFESSANFVEEQKHGVFKKTLRNMLLGVIVFNPLISLVLLNVVTINEIAAAKDFILAEAALKMGGFAMLALISINAFMVLCGAVLTSYVGVSGLITRMVLDECLPSFLLKENSKGSHPRILLVFFAACASILLLTGGDLLSLAGVYTISFLSVMTLFAVGNLVLRANRPELKRPYKAPLLFVLIAAFATLAGIYGNATLEPKSITYFLTYFAPAISLVLAVIYKESMLKHLLHITRKYARLHIVAKKIYENAVSSKFYVFVHHADRLFEVLQYIHKNENGRYVTVIHCEGNHKERDVFEEVLPSLKKAGVFPHLHVTFDYLPQEFSPKTIDEYTRRRRINKNRVFIGSIHHHHEFNYEDLGGVRIIF